MGTSDAVGHIPETSQPGSWPISLSLDVVAAMLNFEFPEHPIYDSGELLWFDDDKHGTGMMAFLRRRSDHRADYYPEPGLRLDTRDFYIGGGIGAWTVTDFDVSKLRITSDGVVAEVCFTDIDGRSVEVRIDDRDGTTRHRSGLLAPVSDEIEQPRALLLVWLPHFDLVRRGGGGAGDPHRRPRRGGRASPGGQAASTPSHQTQHRTLHHRGCT